MDKTKTKLAANLGNFFEHEDDEPAFPPKTVDDAKLTHYAAGVVRKSRREKEQEAAEAKKREEEADAAKAYAEFLDAFEGDGRKSAATFVKAGSSNQPGTSTSIPMGPRGSSQNPFRQSPSPPSTSVRPKGKRAMDSFLEEIKREQAVREAKYSRQAKGPGTSVTALAAYDGQSGSRDRGDSQTSNVFVANLPSHVTEQSLGMFFARMGPVGSVKVMWPRTDGTAGPGADMAASRRSKSTGLSGFVSYMKREDAEDALRELDGFDWGGSILRVGWSKAVPVAAKPMYVTSVQKGKTRGRSRDRKGNSRDRSPNSSYSRSRSRSPKRQRRDYSRSQSPFSRPSSPEADDAGLVTDTFIRAVAAQVKAQDDDYEENLKEREQKNPKYGFMRPGNRRYHVYRNWLNARHALSPEFDDDGYNSVYSTDSAEDSEREHGSRTVLGKYSRRRFEAMLRALSGRRGDVARCMAFSLEHAEAAHEVADIIIASLLVDATPVPRKVARLHLICDILHNSASSVPSAWKFRQEFQSRLGIVFDHLANIYHSFPGRITAETFKKQIIAVVDIWDDWIVFPGEFLAELRSRLEGKAALVSAPEQTTTGNFAATAGKFKTVASSIVDASHGPDEIDDGVDGEPIDDMDGVPIADLDEGNPVGDDVDGEPINELDGEPMDDIDGQPLDDVDGEPLDNVDGIPMDESP
ncbi:hypothetical protein BDZ89DRAFT_1154041 [Hymenopellis radicata]|nr:hypothetical protein BDZ89DRAFT_1154041 [Hymenopellis radicata]